MNQEFYWWIEMRRIITVTRHISTELELYTEGDE